MVVVTAGTPVRLSEVDLLVSEAVMRPDVDNDGAILIGDEDDQVYPVYANEPFRIAGLAINRASPKKNDHRVNLKDVWIDAEVSGDFVAVAYVNRS